MLVESQNFLKFFFKMQILNRFSLIETLISFFLRICDFNQNFYTTILISASFKTNVLSFWNKLFCEVSRERFVTLINVQERF
jgi:hypothetical protein